MARRATRSCEECGLRLTARANVCAQCYTTTRRGRVQFLTKAIPAGFLVVMLVVVLIRTNAV